MRALQREIIAELGTESTIDPVQEIEQRTEWLARELRQRDLGGYVLGISGGQDSLLAGMLAQRAAVRLRDDGYDAAFHALLLPYGEQRDRIDALLAVQTINPDTVHDFNIQAATDAHVATYEAEMGSEVSDFLRGNTKARERMIAQYLYAGAHNLLVIGTDHAAEAITGFFTKFGDGAADILPLSGLNKRQGRHLLQALEAPEVFYTKAPTADLLDNAPGQTDEHELGLRYDDIDDYLEGRRIDPSIAKQLEQRYLLTQHKRELPTAYRSEPTR